MSSCVNWIVLTTPHYDSSASVSMLIPWCQIVLFSMVSLVSFFSWCQIVFFFSWCQIVLFSMVSNCPLYFLGVKLSSFFSWCQIILFSMVSNCPLYFHIMASNYLFAFIMSNRPRILHIVIPLRWSLCWWSPDVGTDDGSREDWFALNRWFCPKPDQIKSHRTRPSCATPYTTPSCFNASSDHSLVQQYPSQIIWTAWP